MPKTITLSPELAAKNPYLAFESTGGAAFHVCTGVEGYDCLAIFGQFEIRCKGAVANSIEPPPIHNCDIGVCPRRNHPNFITK